MNRDEPSSIVAPFQECAGSRAADFFRVWPSEIIASLFETWLANRVTGAKNLLQISWHASAFLCGSRHVQVLDRTDDIKKVTGLSQ